MRRIYSSILTIGLSIIALAQVVNDQISLGPGYANQSFYSMANGEVANIPQDGWDIAFMTDVFNTSMIVNEATGVEVYLYGDISEWDDVTIDDVVEAPLHNDEFFWENGALFQVASPDPFDFGWGAYDFFTNEVQGTRMFIIKLADGTYKKLAIDTQVLGAYTFRIADLDGSNLISETIAGADYSTKNFWYYNIQDEEIIDREPDSDSWDITFTRYMSEVIPDAYYLVTGALQNVGIRASEAGDDLPENVFWGDYPLEEEKNIIGSDWKYFDMDMFAFVLEESLSYFVEDRNGDIWHLVFTDFVGSSSGDIEFTKELVSPTSVPELTGIDFRSFPNPTEGNLTVILPVETSPIEWSLIDLNGRIVERGRWNNGFQHQLDLSVFQSGVYMLQVQTEGRIGQERIVVR